MTPKSWHDRSKRDLETEAERWGTPPMRYFLVERHRTSGDYSVRTFRDGRRALKEYGNRERELLDQNEVIVCLFRADSLETLKQTHGSWFYTLPELIARFAEAVRP